MNRKYSIGIFLGIFVLIAAALTAGYQISYEHAKAQLAKVEEEVKAEEESIRTEGAAQKEDGFILKEKNGFVVVYLRDLTTIYEYTNISVETLPEEIKKELSSGKELKTTQELYGFLENYSS